jgi:hypothetical protein
MRTGRHDPSTCAQCIKLIKRTSKIGLRVFENRVLRRILTPKREEVAGEDCIMRSFTKHY